MEMDLWQRDREGRPHTPGPPVHHSDADSQYTSFKLADHLDAEGTRRVSDQPEKLGTRLDNVRERAARLTGQRRGDLDALGMRRQFAGQPLRPDSVRLDRLQ
ncbi:hypothetical protein [Streptomyces sp. NPDC001750]|uniref:hypothetical protein n=1 Tax=Streptomyces sp. NPDC001750 TaxID=3364607 RepID=UPI00369848C5